MSCKNVSFVQLFCGLWNLRCLYAVFFRIPVAYYVKTEVLFPLILSLLPQIFACNMYAGFYCDRLNCISRSGGKVCSKYKGRSKRVKLEWCELKCSRTAKGTWACLRVRMRKHRCAVQCLQDWLAILPYLLEPNCWNTLKFHYWLWYVMHSSKSNQGRGGFYPANVSRGIPACKANGNFLCHALLGSTGCLCFCIKVLKFHWTFLLITATTEFLWRSDLTKLHLCFKYYWSFVIVLLKSL